MASLESGNSVMHGLIYAWKDTMKEQQGKEPFWPCKHGG
jgi:hypothetical protein